MNIKDSKFIVKILSLALCLSASVLFLEGCSGSSSGGKDSGARMCVVDSESQSIGDPRLIVEFQAAEKAGDETGRAYVFTNLSEVDNDDPDNPTTINYVWDFGDSTGSLTTTSENEVNPEYTYASPGVYMVSLTAMAEGLGSRTFEIEVVVPDISGFLEAIAGNTTTHPDGKQWILRREEGKPAMGIYGAINGQGGSLWELGTSSPLSSRPCVMDDTYVFKAKASGPGQFILDTKDTYWKESSNFGGHDGSASEFCASELDANGNTLPESHLSWKVQRDERTRRDPATIYEYRNKAGDPDQGNYIFELTGRDLVLRSGTRGNRAPYLGLYAKDNAGDQGWRVPRRRVFSVRKVRTDVTPHQMEISMNNPGANQSWYFHLRHYPSGSQTPAIPRPRAPFSVPLNFESQCVSPTSEDEPAGGGFGQFNDATGKCVKNADKCNNVSENIIEITDSATGDDAGIYFDISEPLVLSNNCGVKVKARGKKGSVLQLKLEFGNGDNRAVAKPLTRDNLWETVRYDLTSVVDTVQQDTFRRVAFVVNPLSQGSEKIQIDDFAIDTKVSGPCTVPPPPPPPVKFIEKETFLPLTFESNKPITDADGSVTGTECIDFSRWGNNNFRLTECETNPQKDAAQGNESNQVLKVERTAAGDGGVYVDLETPIDLSVSCGIRLKAYTTGLEGTTTPVKLSLKLEPSGGTDGRDRLSFQLDDAKTLAEGMWQTLNFDLSQKIPPLAMGRLGRLVLTIDSIATVYIDDIEEDYTTDPCGASNDNFAKFPLDFDVCPDGISSDDGGAGSCEDNPVMTGGDNPGGGVFKIVEAASSANARTSFKLDFPIEGLARNCGIKMHAYGPASTALRLGIRGATVSNDATATLGGTANTWHEIKYDFSPELVISDADKITGLEFAITPGTAGSATVYVDNIAVDTDNGKACAGVILPITFDSAGECPARDAFGGIGTVTCPATVGSDKVFQVTDGVTGAQVWAGVKLTLPSTLNFGRDNNNKCGLKLRMRTDRADTVVKLKLEQPGGNNDQNVEVDRTIGNYDDSGMVDSMANTWYDVRFDYSSPTNGSIDGIKDDKLNNIVIFINFGTKDSTPDTISIDKIEYDGEASNCP